MAETIERHGSQPKWHWYNVIEDLKRCGLDGVVIDPLTVNEHGCGGETKKGTRFYITWVPDAFLLLSMAQEEDALVEAFARVVEYRPFCRYKSKESGLLTFEWDKQSPEDRFAELQREGEKDLRRVV
ncbi:MAG: hypothetical protein ABSA74_02865 [Candidatus Staskawiczbacteria bacterium]|jgi:hypothetical protein